MDSATEIFSTPPEMLPVSDTRDVRHAASYVITLEAKHESALSQ